MKISSNELQSHLDRGDKEGPCAEVAPETDQMVPKMPEAPKAPYVTPPPAPDVLPSPNSPSPIAVLLEPPATFAPSGPKDRYDLRFLMSTLLMFYTQLMT